MITSSFAPSYWTGCKSVLISLQKKSRISLLWTFSLFRHLYSRHHDILSYPWGKSYLITGFANSTKSSSLLALQRISTGINLYVNLLKPSCVSLIWSIMARLIFLRSIWGRIQSISFMKTAPGMPKSKMKKILSDFCFNSSIS